MHKAARDTLRCHGGHGAAQSPVSASKQVVTENYEESHLGGKAEGKQDFRGTERNEGEEWGIWEATLEEAMSQMRLEG